MITTVYMGKNQWVSVVANLALIMTVVGAAWLTVGELGVGETWDVISGDCAANCTQETNVTFSGNNAGPVSFSDRVVTAGAVVTLLVGLGAVSISASQPKVFNDIIRYLPLLIGVIALIEFNDIFQSYIQGSYDFDIYSDGQNSLHLFVVGSIMAAGAKLLGKKN